MKTANTTASIRRERPFEERKENFKDVQVAQALCGVLADTYLLYLKTQNFHWNVTGPHFRSLHLLFEEQYGELAASVDTVAERIRALGSRAPGSFAEFKELSGIVESRGDLDWGQMISELTADHYRVCETLQQACDLAEAEGDAPTHDMMASRLEAHQKHIWMLESLVEASPRTPREGH